MIARGLAPVLVAAALCGEARANPIDAFGFGARAASMGGAHTAAAADGSANYYNPALLASFDEIRIDVGYQLARPALAVDGLGLDVDTSRGVSASLSAPGRLGPLRIAIAGAVCPEGFEPVVEDAYLSLHTVAQDLFQPAQVTAGLSARVTPRLALAFDVALHRWSGFEHPAAHIEIDLDVGTFNDLIDLPDAPPLPDPRFRDTVVPRLGVEWLGPGGGRASYAVRAGYSYEPSPAPAQIGESNFIDNDKHTASVGGGVTLAELGEILLQPVTLDGFVAVTVLRARDHHKVSPVDPVGDYRSTGRVWQAGVSSRWRF